MFTIDITDRVTAFVHSTERLVRSGGVEKVMERALTNRVQDHLFQRDASHPNKLGGDRTHWASQAAKSTHGDSKPGEVTVTISQVGFRQRLEGGTIRPVKAKMLTIPATPEAYGRRASEFHNLRFAVLNGHPALIETRATRVTIGRKKKDGTRSVKATSSSTGLKVFFWLARSVNQVADPSLLPTSQVLIDTALKAADEYLARQAAKGGTL